jgi:exodeoxyribonuclease V beta subunit
VSDLEPLDPLRLALDGTILVEASAGTGKTHTITTLYVRLLVEHRLAPAEILVVTFTEAATAELRDRVRRRVQAAHRVAVDPASAVDPRDRELVAIVAPHGERAIEGLAAALRDFDTAAISTIHGFCQRALHEHAFESGSPFGLELLPDQRPLIAELAADFWAVSAYGAPPAAVRALGTSGPGTVLSVMQALAAYPAATVVPGAAPDRVAELERAYRAAFADARALWGADERAIVRLLATSDGLSHAQAHYGPERVEACREALDGFFAGAEPPAPPKLFDFVTTARLDKARLARGEPPSHRFFARCDALARAHDDLVGAIRGHLLGVRRRAVDYLRAELPRRKDELRVCSFDDLLGRLDAALSGPRGPALAAALRGRLRALLVDEFQDTDPVQYRIVRAIAGADGAGGPPLLLIGDPKQSIYAFRGADVLAYLDAVRDARARTTIGENHRSDPSLVRAVSTLFGGVSRPFLREAIAMPDVAAVAKRDRLAGAGPGALEILFVPPSADGKLHAKGVIGDALPGAIAAEIAALFSRTPPATVDGEAVGPKHVAVLTRTNDQARRVQDALRAAGIPSVLESEASVFASREAEEVARVLAAVAEPGSAMLVRSALATDLLGVSGDALGALEAGTDGWAEWFERFERWHEVWRTRGFVQAYRRLLAEREVVAGLLRFADGERRVTNVLHLGELLHDAATRRRLGPGALVHWLGAMRAGDDDAALGAEAAQIRLESDADAVRLCTVHKSKGLEYPIVYCPYAWDGLLLRRGAPLRVHDDDGRLVFDLAASAENVPRAEDEAMAESLRLLYVALTRAAHRASVVWGPIKDHETSALGYLLHPAKAPSGVRPLEAARQHLRALGPARLRGDLDALAGRSRGAIHVRDLDLFAATSPRFVAAAREPSPLSARAFTGRVAHGWRLDSFTGLVAHAGDAPRAEDDGRDRDANPADEHAPPPPDAGPPAVAPRVTLHALPGGARTGDMLHALLEALDFQADDAEVARVAGETLEAFGLPVARFLDVVVRGVGELLDTPLDAAPDAPRLRGLPRSRRLDELEFCLPVAEGARFTSSALADAFEAHASAAVPEGYAARVRRLGFAPLRGFLRGFVDLVFEHGGRYWLVDYKSNRLGECPDDYGPARLAEAMAHSHYVLQYHLYALALHRHLARTVRDYDYERHFGGVYYLFARGMSPERGPARGIHRDRPPRAMLDALSALLAPANEAAR